MKLGYPGSLHNHTDYSNLRLRDSINRVESLIDYAVELGHDVIAITEHESISNAIKVEKYYNKIKEKNPNFKVIRGNEIYLVPDGLTPETYDSKVDRFWHFILLAKDAEGHKQIRELSTRAWERAFSYRRMMRVPTYYQDLIDIVGSNPGHVIGSTACLGGFLPAKILQYRSMDLGKNELYQKIIGWCNAMQNIFGKGNFFFEMQPSNNEEQIIVNKELLTLSNRLDIPYIITTDSHYLKKSDASIHEAYLNSQDGDREVKSFYATTYMMGTEELESFFEYFDEYDLQMAYQNILKIKDMCSDYSLLKPLKIPELQWRPFASNKDSYYYWGDKIPMLKTFIDSPHKSDRCLVDAIIEGIENHADLQNEESYKELNENLERTWISSEVNKARWSAYYLNLQFTIDKCWEAETVVGPSRGSGGGFLLLYCLDIIQMNKLREPTPMYPWRFLNPSRVSVLDIDTDIEGGRRPKVLSHLREVYGEDRMANVVTFGTEKSKSAILTAARGLGIEVDTAQYISSLVPADRGQLRTLTQCYYGDEDKGFAPVTQFINEMNNYPDLWEVAKSIEGLVCRTGIHAGGIIFVDEPFTESTALMRAPDGTLCTQFDLHDCEDVSQP